MERSSFFNSVNRDRRYKAEDFARYFASFIGNGVFPIPSNGLQVIGNNNMTVTLKPGKAWINGYFYWNDNDLVLNIEPADGVLNRIDRVVIRLDYLKREIKTYIKKGNFASSPVAPSLQRDADMYELGIADIKVNKGAISISNANITDTRLNKSLCGIVHGVIEQIDPTELFNQYQLYLNEKINSNEFSDWLNSLKDKLDPNSDLAVQLQVQIDSLVSQVEEMNNKIENIDLSADKVIVNNSNLNSKDVNSALTELFTFADNGKKNWVDVIGSPLSTGDNFSTLKSKTQNLKNTFASNLNNKKISASGTESLNNLVNKIKNINVDVKYAKGSLEEYKEESYVEKLYTIDNLTFIPKMLILEGNLNAQDSKLANEPKIENVCIVISPSLGIKNTINMFINRGADMYTSGTSVHNVNFSTLNNVVNINLSLKAGYGRGAISCFSNIKYTLIGW